MLLHLRQGAGALRLVALLGALQLRAASHVVVLGALKLSAVVSGGIERLLQLGNTCLDLAELFLHAAHPVGELLHSLDGILLAIKCWRLPWRPCYPVCCHLEEQRDKVEACGRERGN